MQSTAPGDRPAGGGAATLVAANQALVAERDELRQGDLRMTKLHEKISGGWRSMEGTRAFLAVRSYLGTARKQGQGMLDVLTAAFEGRLWMPATAGP